MRREVLAVSRAAARKLLWSRTAEAAAVLDARLHLAEQLATATELAETPARRRAAGALDRGEVPHEYRQILQAFFGTR